MSDKPLAREREPIERVRARLEALVRANAAPRCGARSKRTGKPCGANGSGGDRQALPRGSHAERPVQGSRRQEYWAAHARGSRAQQAGKLEAWLLLPRSEGGTVAPASGNTCAPRPVRLDLRPPAVPRAPVVPRSHCEAGQTVAAGGSIQKDSGLPQRPAGRFRCILSLR
jgi:hypothetical protein